MFTLNVPFLPELKSVYHLQGYQNPAPAGAMIFGC